ncbi:MAG: CPBP family intramembrane metalloprotease [Chlorobiaceae bacterium]|nr:CPBP family intramembrane metalloprotease [Chlorobiaceae bacterium]NTV15820.1 CPBP family intramembrane metalloprotease [Chlorobiaceae bacterium]
MTAFVAIPVVAAAGAALLLLGRRVVRRGGVRLVLNTEVDRQLLYQPLSAGIAAAAVLGITVLLPESASYFNAGNLDASVAGLNWMGVEPSDTWLSIGISIGLIITAVTTIVVWLQAKQKGELDVRHMPWLFILAVPFAVVNSAVEEAIFRLALCNALGATLSMMKVALISGLLFGLPHYFGHPGKFPGVVLAGFLGWLMCLSVLQTGGIAWAWVVHFVQDVVIFTLLFTIAATRLDREKAGKQPPL